MPRIVSLAVCLVLSPGCAHREAQSSAPTCPPCAEVAAAAPPTTPAVAEVTPAVAAAEPPARATPVPADGAVTFDVYEAFLSPAQEPGEESETPKALQGTLGATAPSTPRKERKSRGYGQVRVARDLSRAVIDVQVEGVRAEDVLMFHIHCGPPGVLGPILVDLGKLVDLKQELADGRYSAEVTDAQITFVDGPPPKGHGLKLPEGCPIEQGFMGQVKTIAGLDYLARKGVLYFNLHTKAHTYFGEMRGQIHSNVGR